VFNGDAPRKVADSSPTTPASPVRVGRLGQPRRRPAAEIVTAPGAGGGPHVRAFKQDGSTPFGGGFFAYTNWGGGVEVAIGGGGS